MSLGGEASTKTLELDSKIFKAYKVMESTVFIGECPILKPPFTADLPGMFDDQRVSQQSTFNWTCFSWMTPAKSSPDFTGRSSAPLAHPFSR